MGVEMSTSINRPFLPSIPYWLQTGEEMNFPLLACQAVIMLSRSPATSASLFHVISRCSSTSFALDSFSSYCLWHSSNNSVSISRNIFRTLTVNPWTA
ncbi:unnamed protein product [Linum trigynum]|uniref:Uncharacterized protein n=1 Tax=Linum trigynum TaxID=586398 RepID=A0AAV2FIZ1_9ROSI